MQKTKLVTRSNGKEIQLEIAIHQHNRGVIVIYYPGVNGSLDGHNNQAVELSDFLVSENIGAVVRAPNPLIGPEFSENRIANLRTVVEYALSHGNEICGNSTPKLYLMGYSAGASSSSAIARDYSQIEKVLLLGPYCSDEENSFNIKDFLGEVYAAAGNLDNGGFTAEVFHGIAAKARKKELKIMHGFDHGFNGKVDEIFKKAARWAFKRLIMIS